PAPVLAPDRGPGRALHGATDARPDGPRRDLRPARRRLPPLLRRRGVAGPSLREDALRPVATRPSLPPCLAGHRGARLPSGGGGDARLRPPGDDASRRRLLLDAGRRLRGRGGALLPLGRGG